MESNNRMAWVIVILLIGCFWGTYRIGLGEGYYLGNKASDKWFAEALGHSSIGDNRYYGTSEFNKLQEKFRDTMFKAGVVYGVVVYMERRIPQDRISFEAIHEEAKILFMKETTELLEHQKQVTE